MKQVGEQFKPIEEPRPRVVIVTSLDSKDLFVLDGA
jgi:hypothetical protein